MASLAQRRGILYGAFVAAQARDHITTEDLLAVTASTRDTLYRWVAQGLLKRPRIDADLSGRRFAAWAPDALERVRFIVAGLQGGQTMDEITDLMNKRWPRQ
jgi:DNA-binding transcriptional MerR regulator